MHWLRVDGDLVVGQMNKAYAWSKPMKEKEYRGFKDYPSPPTDLCDSVHVLVREDGEERPLEPRLDLRQHSSLADESR